MSGTCSASRIGRLRNGLSQRTGPGGLAPPGPVQPCRHGRRELQPSGRGGFDSQTSGPRRSLETNASTGDNLDNFDNLGKSVSLPHTNLPPGRGQLLSASGGRGQAPGSCRASGPPADKAPRLPTRHCAAPARAGGAAKGAFADKLLATKASSPGGQTGCIARSPGELRKAGWRRETRFDLVCCY